MNNQQAIDRLVKHLEWGWTEETVEAIDMGMHALIATQWIPCSERLPENDKKVLCYVESSMRVGDDIVTGSQHDGLWFMQSGVGMQSFSKACTVTAWMPLPKQYREDE